MILYSYASAQSSPNNENIGFDQKAAILQDALKTNPSDIKSRMELGSVFMLQGKYDTAAIEFKEVISRKPDYLPAYFALSTTLQRKAKPDYVQAFSILEKASIAAPGNASVPLNMGYLYAAQGKYQKALNKFQETMRLTDNPPVLASAHLGMGAVYQTLKDSARAKEEYNEAFKIDPQLKDVLIHFEGQKVGEDQKSELSVGRIIDFAIIQQYPVLNKPGLTQAITLIGERLALNSANPHLKFTFKVLNAPGLVNTFCAPGGYIYVTSGLLDFIEKDLPKEERIDALSFILAHEIAHVCEKHGLKRLKTMELHAKIMAPLTDIAFIGLAGLADANIGKLGLDPLAEQAVAGQSTSLSAAISCRTTDLLSQVVYKAYCRSEEFQADTLAVGYMSKAGYNPSIAVAFLNKFQESKEYKDKNIQPGLFSTHPRMNGRINNIEGVLDPPKRRGVLAKE